MTIIHIPASFTMPTLPPPDPRDPVVEDKYARLPTDEEVEAARLANELERKTLPFRLRSAWTNPLAQIPREHGLPNQEAMDVLDATNGLYELIQRYGAQRVMSWVRNLAAMAGQETE